MASFRGIPPREHGRFPLRRDAFDADRLPPARQDIFRTVERRIAEPFGGITADGTIRPDLHILADAPRIDVGPAVATAQIYLEMLSDGQRGPGHLPMDSAAWRWWTNAFPTWTPHGLLLDDLDEAQRATALGLIACCLSESGYRQVRSTMLFNELLGQLIEDYPQTLREFMYRFTVFGRPSAEGAWGWQLAGHHLDVHCALIDGRAVLTPVFMGAEPTVIDSGPHAGARLFAGEADAGRELMASFSAAERGSALLFPSMETALLPPHLNHPTEGRMRSAAGADNLVLPYEGLAAADMSAASQRRLTDVIALYTAIQPATTAAARLREAERHFADTHFSWVGGWGPADPFYYRIHSPVILIELDHHRGVFLANEEPTPFHVHTVVRMPNGNDYGREFLRQHRLTT
jgi:hypothetical protein